MKAFHSNRLEILAERLISLLRRPLSGDPLAPERIVVPHRTIERWLRLEIARATGIAANLKFELPATFAWSMMREAIRDLPADHPYAPNRLRWRLYDLLPRLDDLAEDIPKPWLAGGDPRRTFDLANSLAIVYDRCLLYRPQQVREWEKSDSPSDRKRDWQIRLWQRLIEEDPKSLRHPLDEDPKAPHWANALVAFRQTLLPESVPEAWPKRTFFFGISSFSPSYLEFIETLRKADRQATHELNLFILSPSSEYWSALRSPREADRGSDPNIDEEDRHFDFGNELVTGWARIARSSFDRLVGENEEEIDCYEIPEGNSRLARVQRDILELRSAAEGASAAEEISDEDDSLQIHVCHFALREAEVLHDRLLDIMRRDPEISPADISVLTPSPSVYGPAIKAVFESEGKIPVRLSRPKEADSSAIRAFVELLALPASRYEAPRVLAPLDAAAVRARFGIEEESLPLIRQWIRDAGIRWGIDAEHRAARGLPKREENTWRQGLKRLLIGYAVADDDDSVCDLVPCPIRGVGGLDPGTADYERLGGLVSYCEGIFALDDSIDRGKDRPAKDWAAELHRIVDRFFGAPAHGRQSDLDLLDDIEGIRRLIEQFSKEASPSPSAENTPAKGSMSIDFAVVRDAIETMAEGLSVESARLADAATVMSLAQGRIFPAKVVCVVGMNDGVFPRNPSIPTFDLVAAKPEPGDQDARLEDRFAFLEALLAARDCFIVSYTGRNIRNDEEIPPSVLVGEWLDYLRKRFGLVDDDSGDDSLDDSGDDNNDERILCRHPLQPFNPRYFEQRGDKKRSPLFSYSKEMRAAAQALQSDRQKEAPLDRRLLNPLPDDSKPDDAKSEKPASAADVEKSEGLAKSMTLDDLISFFINPTKGFLDKSLRIALRKPEDNLESEEIFSLDPLSRYGARRTLFRHRKDDGGIARSLAILQSAGRIPHGVFGEVDLERQRRMIQGLEEKLSPYRTVLDQAPQAIDIDIDGVRILGALGSERASERAKDLIGNADSEKMVFWRLGSLRAKDRLEIYLRQLAWSLSEGRRYPVDIVHYDNKSEQWKIECIDPPDDPQKILLSWLKAWRQGQSRPLVFFPETSMAFASVEGGKRDSDPWRDAHRKWKGSEFSEIGGEESDPFFSLVFEKIDIFAGDDEQQDFAANARDLLLPLVVATSDKDKGKGKGKGKKK